ncbi:XrtA-associated tyrosine autokinase [Aquabacterium sp.]|uniref:XrtA-associated tyrosine autokinase n=1 Tax=Aquabacterium sp. TaxID=1872578 RepID=UPI0035B3A6EE
MNLIEQAAKRIEELRRAGVDVPWAAAGFKEGETLPEAVVCEPSAPRAPDTSVAKVIADAVQQPGVAESTEPDHLTSLDKPIRRSRVIDLDLRRLSEAGYLVPGQERSQLEEEFRIIKRPLIKNAMGDTAAQLDRANLIMVTSALPGEGKTYTAINLAMSMALELDHTVLLVDADVVHPSVLDRLGLPPAKGLMDLLTDPGLDLSDVLLRTNIPKLVVLPAGTPSSRSTELLASGVMEELLDELAQSYDDRIVIFDTPPLLPSTESRVLATHMGQVAVVVEADQTTQGTVTQAFATLETCPVVMAVLNKSRGLTASSKYGYYAV